MFPFAKNQTLASVMLRALKCMVLFERFLKTHSSDGFKEAESAQPLREKFAVLYNANICQNADGN